MEFFFSSVQRLSFERIWLWHFSAEINNIYIYRIYISKCFRKHIQNYIFIIKESDRILCQNDKLTDNQ